MSWERCRRLAAGRYRIAAYTADGRLIAVTQIRLEAGGAMVDVENVSGPARVTVISVKGGEWRLTQKVVRRD